MKVLGVLLVLLWLADGLRLRRRLRRLPVLSPSAGEGVAERPPVTVLAAPGVVVRPPVLEAASAHLEAAELDVLDLLPEDLPVEALLAFLTFVDPEAARTHPFVRGRSAGTALLARPEVAERAGVRPPTDPLALHEASAVLKHYAPLSMGHALARGLYAGPEPRAYQRAILEEVTGNAGLHLAGQALILLFLAAVLLAEPRYGVAALFAFHLQPLLVTLGTRARPRDLLRTLALRAPRAALTWLRLVFGSGVRAPDPIEARRAEYVRLLAGGTDRFFEPRRETCPLCEGTRLRLQLETTDLLQHKPGRFRLDRCQGCGHIFQNPRLSLQGLDFYYRDFYDGLGERNLEGIFGMSMRAYRARAQMLEGAPIHRWLDVGTGHGHFPFAARQRFPSVTFDGLDLASSVLEAERRGWIDRAYQGLFPDLADELAGQYDVVSMSHYLEHTREPEAEIAAAAKVLRPGGHLLIEVPDPECWMKDRLGRWWLPYFQPQHQHFLSTQNLARLLRAHGFEVVRWHRGEAHQPVDWLAAAVLLLGALAPGPRPWRPKRWHDRVLPFLVWPLGAPLIAAGALLDRATAERKRVPGGSNTYRVLARRAPER